MVKILASEDETDEMETESGSSEASSSDDELDLPEGTYIVQKVVDHECYGELRRCRLIDERRNEHYDNLFFRVKWKGFPGEDTWEPLRAIRKVYVFKEYARKHNLLHLILTESDSNSESLKSGVESEEDEMDSGSSKEIRGKNNTVVDSKFRKNQTRGGPETTERSSSTECPEKIPIKKTWWFRGKNFDSEELTSRKRKDLSDDCCSGGKIQKLRQLNYSQDPRHIRKFVKQTADGFSVIKRRTRSISPIIDRVLRGYDVNREKEFRDDQKFLESTKISAAVGRVELTFLAKQLEQGWILRFFWKKIKSRKLCSPLHQIRNAKPQELENTIDRIIEQCKILEEQCASLRTYVGQQNIIKFEKGVRNIKDFCSSIAENSNAVIYGRGYTMQDTIKPAKGKWLLLEKAVPKVEKDILTLSENSSIFVAMLRIKCYPPKHRICRFFKVALSCLSMEYRAKFFEHLRRETNHQVLNIVTEIARTGGRFCILDTLVKYGIDVGCTKTCAVQQCVLNGDEEAAIHLLLVGFGAKHMEPSSDFSLDEQTFEILNSMNIYMDRLNLKIQNWTMELLKEYSTEFAHYTDSFPMSSFYIYRVGQVDRKVCLNVSSTKSRQGANYSAGKSQVLIMHLFGLSPAASIKDIGIHRCRTAIQFHKHLHFRLGTHLDEMNLILVMQKRGSYIYWFPLDCSNDLGARVHVKLSYTPVDYSNKNNDLVVLQLWNIQISPALLLALREKAERSRNSRIFLET